MKNSVKQAKQDISKELATPKTNTDTPAEEKKTEKPKEKKGLFKKIFKKKENPETE
ncbi:hypothetical protein [Chryseobacterium indoltheticum]|uniref:hypothetical protein n=1 Tax=Chryseobacterium indoltheticum TaxID=254 RepID=UPI0015F28C22|nr:hypothetical protein [Chryseobacterium indoltheticum]